MKKTSQPLSPRLQYGASLIEVLVAVLIMGVGLLGIAAMQSTALRNSQSSLERSQAVIQTYAILDAMRANRAAAIAGAYDMERTCDAPTGASLVDYDRREWINSMEAAMGDAACGTINCPAGGTCTITVDWDDSRGTAISGATTRSVTTTTLL
ncbi:type IV pilus modification protein PilV [Pseudoxanthomonas sp. z9]|uniref:type IV pilus modification protein PilV n=1 Tax=Pseudoxanthomonas sp. z9 TaxID=2584942 RepID=UPI00114402F3|nr:type IV pilus modification protein PilV [Pseudoxanthomonas sp. z9]MCL6713997.1 type IV pilus modification protein PilV [Pseudomonas sp. R2.Fl]